MSIDKELLLPRSVEVFPVRELAPEVRAKIDATDEDYAITRRHSRARSRIIDKASADLLRIFRVPSSIVDAVLSFTSQRGLNPEVTLEEAYPLLFNLYRAQILIPADRENQRLGQRNLELGTSIEGFRLLRLVQALDDNVVLLARNSSGQYAAVKFYREPNHHTVRALEREAAMLERVGSKRAPQFYSLARIDLGMALVTEWVFGLDAMTAAGAIRRESSAQQRLLALCAEIATAYANVHESGVLHGDVHPRNVLVDGRGSARIIDFGLSDLIDGTLPPAPRGGIAFYFDPEFAEAQRSHKRAQLSPLGEQYSVAALLYQLWTGVYYIDWSLERHELLRQIVEEDPVSFETRKVPGWPALEAILQRALAKTPERRFPTMRAFAEALRTLLPEAEERDRQSIIQRKERGREDELLNGALQNYALGGNILRDGLSEPPFASINYGAAGIAYAIYSIARHRGDPQLLALADVWTQKAFTLSSHEKAFYDPALEIEPATVGEISLFHSLSGLYCVRALVSIAMGDVNGAYLAIQRFVARSRGPCEHIDLTLGKASLLLGCSELVEAMEVPWFFEAESVRIRGNEIAAELVQSLRLEEPATSRRIKPLGIAHGWAGLAFALIRWARAIGQQPDPIAVKILDELAGLAEPYGNGTRWPVHNNKSSFMEGWCNGTAGHVMLLALAYDVFRDGRFAELAERAAMSMWPIEIEHGTLCCGLGGIGYAFLAIYRLTGSNVWLERAHAAARRAAADSSKHFFRDALYKGAVGVAVLADDLKHPESAAMPLFEPVS